MTQFAYSGWSYTVPNLNFPWEIQVALPPPPTPGTTNYDRVAPRSLINSHYSLYHSRFFPRKASWGRVSYLVVRQTARWHCRETDRDKQTDSETGRKTKRWECRERERQTDTKTSRRTNRDRQMDEREGQTKRRMDRERGEFKLITGPYPQNVGDEDSSSTQNSHKQSRHTLLSVK